MRLPKITVIIAVLNMRQSLSRAIESVLGQDYPKLELIVMDGGSTDGTLEIIQQYQSHLHYWSSQPDKGHIDACNKAIMQATGDFIMLLNADDTLAPNLFNKVATLHNQYQDTQMISCGAMIKNADNVVIRVLDAPEDIDLTLKNILFGLPIINARFFHRSLFKIYGEFKSTFIDDRYYVSNDREFLARLCLQDVKTKIIAEVLYHYYSHAQSLTFGNDNLLRIHQEHAWLADELLKNKMTQEHYHLVKSWRARQLLTLIWLFLKKKEYRKAFFLMNKVTMLDFFLMLVQAKNILIKSMRKFYFH